MRPAAPSPVRVERVGGPEWRRDLIDVLRLQRALLIDARGPAPPPPGGFLVGRLAPAELKELLRSGGRAFVARDGAGLLGYALVTTIDGFLGFLGGPISGTFVPSSSAVDFAAPRDEYLYQIAVARQASRRGIGTRLLDACRAPGRALITDALIEPFANVASLRFFKDRGFCEVGRLVLARHPGFGRMASVVMRTHA